MIREFRVQCDKCLATSQAGCQFSEDAKNEARANGWQVGNKAVCPTCRRLSLMAEAEALRAQADALLDGVL